MERGRFPRRWLGAGLALWLAVGTLSPGPVGAADYDPPLLGWTWPAGTTGCWRFGSFPSTSWMRTAVTNAINTISHSPYRNPDFEFTTGTSANITVEYLDSSVTSCAGKINWIGCAKTTATSPFRTWWVWLASRTASGTVCWTNGTGGRTCGSDTGAYDAETVTINEMGHVNILGHHVNPAYADAVVQAAPVKYPNTDWQMRTLRWADTGRLLLLYGRDPCVIPPCPLGAGS